MPARRNLKLAACPPKPALKDRPLMDGPVSAGLAGFFKVLANDTRLRILHAVVREGELPVVKLAQSLGMKPQAVSNQLQRLASLGIVGPERRGTSIYYRILDPCVPELLDRGLCLNEDRKRG